MTNIWIDRIAQAAALCALGLASLAVAPAAANPNDPLPQAGHVLMMRHAYAPGFGDPPGFRLDDCASQRNLDATGRAQATAAGDWLRARGVHHVQVYASQWCRCQETAQLLRLGPVTPLPALNSFFERPQDRDSTVSALRTFLAQQPADGPLLVLVTHHVNIQAVAGMNLDSGDAVLLKLLPGGATQVVGRLDFGARPYTARVRSCLLPHAFSFGAGRCVDTRLFCKPSFLWQNARTGCSAISAARAPCAHERIPFDMVLPPLRVLL